MANHTPTVVTVTKPFTMLSPECSCGWKGVSVSTSVPDDVTDVLTGGRSAATAQLKEHVRSLAIPYRYLLTESA